MPEAPDMHAHSFLVSHVGAAGLLWGGSRVRGDTLSPVLVL